MEYPKVFEDVVECFNKLPGIGNKSAQRMAYHLLNMDKSFVEEFSSALTNFIDGIKQCEVCGHLCHESKCFICQDEFRDKNTICVVENYQDVYAMEKIKEYRGVYHVLHGNVSMIDGRSIEDLNIESLFCRLDHVEEVIIATNPTREGETTALYLAKLLQDKNIAISRIANGLPIGSNIDYADELTLLRSLEGRKKL